MDPAVKTLKAALEAVRDIAANALNQVGHSQWETFNAMEMQSVRICKAFHEACSVGSRWQMPPMQEHGVQTCSVRRVEAQGGN